MTLESKNSRHGAGYFKSIKKLWLVFKYLHQYLVIKYYLNTQNGWSIWKVFFLNFVMTIYYNTEHWCIRDKHFLYVTLLTNHMYTGMSVHDKCCTGGGDRIKEYRWMHNLKLHNIRMLLMSANLILHLRLTIFSSFFHFPFTCFGMDAPRPRLILIRKRISDLP